MFGDPCPLPNGANVIDLTLWIYCKKVNRTKKNIISAIDSIGLKD